MDQEGRGADGGARRLGQRFCFLRDVKGMQNLRGAMQAAEDRYLEVHPVELKEFTKTGGMIGWYGHLKEIWGLHGNKV